MTTPTSPLTNQIVLVTGGGSGINLAFAKLAVQHGARVLIGDLKLTPEGEAFIASQASSSRRAAIFAKCDVTKRADLENLVSVAEKEWGAVPDVYVAGAGVFEPVCI
jgi:NAD(P)-dependent dehydrogenase (short-subunit alcohol dehydrogenase family)